MNQEEPTLYPTAEIKGELMYLHAVTVALIRSLPDDRQLQFFQHFETEAEAARVHMLNNPTPEPLMESFELFVENLQNLRD